MSHRPCNPRQPPPHRLNQLWALNKPGVYSKNGGLGMEGGGRAYRQPAFLTPPSSATGCGPPPPHSGPHFPWTVCSNTALREILSAPCGDTSPRRLARKGCEKCWLVIQASGIGPDLTVHFLKHDQEGPTANFTVVIDFAGCFRDRREGHFEFFEATRTNDGICIQNH